MIFSSKIRIKVKIGISESILNKSINSRRYKKKIKVKRKITYEPQNIGDNFQIQTYAIAKSFTENKNYGITNFESIKKKTFDNLEKKIKIPSNQIVEIKDQIDTLGRIGCHINYKILDNNHKNGYIFKKTVIYKMNINYS